MTRGCIHCIESSEPCAKSPGTLLGFYESVKISVLGAAGGIGANTHVHHPSALVNRTPGSVLLSLTMSLASSGSILKEPAALTAMYGHGVDVCSLALFG